MPRPAELLSTQRRAALVSLGVGAMLLATKWVAYWLTGSHAILSDALESIVNVVASGFVLLSVLLSERPPDPKYPYGYGKITYFSAGFEGGLITLAACAIVYEAIQGLVLGERLQRLNHGLVILVVASAGNLALGLWLISKSRQTRSLVLLADGRHVLTDAWTTIGVMLGVGLVLLTGWQWLDGVVAILVALNVLWTGYGLVRAAFVGLMDRADPAMLQAIVEALQSVRQPGWNDLHQLRAWQAGDRTFVDFHLLVPRYWTVSQVHDAHVLCQDTLRAALGPATEIIIHFDPDPRERLPADRDRPWTVEGAVHVPRAGELGSESSLTQPVRAVTS